MVTKGLRLSDFLRVSRRFFLPKGAWPRGIPGTQPQAGDCRFRLLFSAQLSCLCPLPSCSNRTPQHEFSVHVQLLIQTGPFPNFGLGRFSVRPPFFNATENTQFPFRRRSTCQAGNTGAVRGTFQHRPTDNNEQGLGLAHAAVCVCVCVAMRENTRARRCDARCTHAAPRRAPFSLGNRSR